MIAAEIAKLGGLLYVLISDTHKPIQRCTHWHSIPIPTYHDKRRRAQIKASCGYCFTRISCRRNSCGNAHLRFKVSSVHFKAGVYRASIVLPLRRKPAGNVRYNQNTGHCVRHVLICRRDAKEIDRGSLDCIADRACMVCRYQSGIYPRGWYHVSRRSRSEQPRTISPHQMQRRPHDRHKITTAADRPERHELPTPAALTPHQLVRLPRISPKNSVSRKRGLSSAFCDFRIFRFLH